jgi:Ca2+-dependent lipid-binding protein
MTTVTVHVMSGKGLAAMDKNGLSDPYVYIKVMDKKGKKKKSCQTKVHPETLNPTWLESFVLYVDPSATFDVLATWQHGSMAGWW